MTPVAAIVLEWQGHDKLCLQLVDFAVCSKQIRHDKWRLHDVSDQCTDRLLEAVTVVYSKMM